MSSIITFEQYAGPYLDSQELTLEKQDNARALLGCVNPAIAQAENDGVIFQLHVHSGSLVHPRSDLVAGQANGGFRPLSCPEGAPYSAHKMGMAVDVYDPDRLFARWCLRNIEALKGFGIKAMENPQWTPTWVHLQTRVLASGNFIFIPAPVRALADPLPEQMPDHQEVSNA